jgi:hypothetical protein
VEIIVANLSGTSRRTSFNGRNYIVAPLSLIVPGVLNGSKGPLLYSADEVAATVDSWNGMPIVVRHPLVNGQPVSARRPDVLEKSKIGRVYEAKVEDGRLVAEGWFDVEAVKRVDTRILNALEIGAKIELSTGLFTEPEEGKATFNGKEYVGVAKKIRPDHLAILPDEIGACSISDGCGVNNSEQGLFSRFLGWLKGQPTDTNKLISVLVNKDGTKENLDSTIPGDTTVKLSDADRAALIGSLAVNCKCDQDKEALGKLSDDALKGLAANRAPEPKPSEKPAEVPVAAPVVNRLTPEEQETLNWALAERNKQKVALVDRLISNVADPEQRKAKGAKFMQKPLPELQELAELIPVGNQEQAAPVHDFSKPLYYGAAGAPVTHGAKDDSKNVLPDYDIYAAAK